mmetsp:Transcript_56364/g.121902  ORF Transcript_56364/g.121902 Transcript_56364/m.121902 type:complete len:112 (+) Transcript_56364:419-754(+)
MERVLAPNHPWLKDTRPVLRRLKHGWSTAKTRRRLQRQVAEKSFKVFGTPLSSGVQMNLLDETLPFATSMAAGCFFWASSERCIVTTCAVARLWSKQWVPLRCCTAAESAS